MICELIFFGTLWNISYFKCCCDELVVRERAITQSEYMVDLRYLYLYFALCETISGCFCESVVGASNVQSLFLL